MLPAVALGRRAAVALDTAGDLALLLGRMLHALLRERPPLAEIGRVFDDVAVRSLSIVCLTALFTGLVLALQTGIGLQRFGAAEYTGYVVGLAIVREIGPVLTSLVAGGRVAGGMAAELGSMQVTDQVDALRAMGIDPVRKLVLPRVLCCTLALPMLTVLADALSIAGGAWISSAQFRISPHFFLETIRQQVRLSDVGSGIAKTFFFGFAISLIASARSIDPRRHGGGRTRDHRAVVQSSITVLAVDFFLTKLFLMA